MKLIICIILCIALKYVQSRPLPQLPFIPIQPGFAQLYPWNNMLSQFQSPQLFDNDCVCSCDDCSKLDTCCQKKCFQCRPQKPLIIPYPFPVIISELTTRQCVEITTECTVSTKTTTLKPTTTTTTEKCPTEGTSSTASTECTPTTTDEPRPPETTTQKPSTEETTTKQPSTDTQTTTRSTLVIRVTRSSTTTKNPDIHFRNIQKRLIRPTIARKGRKSNYGTSHGRYIPTSPLRNNRRNYQEDDLIIPISRGIGEELMSYIDGVEPMAPDIFINQPYRQAGDEVERPSYQQSGDLEQQPGQHQQSTETDPQQRSKENQPEQLTTASNQPNSQQSEEKEEQSEPNQQSNETEQPLYQQSTTGIDHPVYPQQSGERKSPDQRQQSKEIEQRVCELQNEEPNDAENVHQQYITDIEQATCKSTKK